MAAYPPNAAGQAIGRFGPLPVFDVDLLGFGYPLQLVQQLARLALPFALLLHQGHDSRRHGVALQHLIILGRQVRCVGPQKRVLGRV